mgnify:CR=1 FL=1
MRSSDDKAARFAESAPICFSLPWPAPSLSPNRRQHWSKLAQAKSIYRTECCEVVLLRPRCKVPTGPLALSLAFCPPDKRKYDRDNLLARMKSGLDGVCDALGFDDARFETITVRVLPSEAKPGRVEVRIGEVMCS